ncbi:uncharacterized protein LOC133527106 [Cydia pomonella]|uniref:uncharacterized protein LOC133527106 n=1 Tax=Cydia pomonella TaxID=82600 RepID=UPI002ADDE03F|nr:uncharacterized protein LOC133527106 [Cydia pomonella]
MRYLGIVLDSRWTFKKHFEGLVPKLIGAVSALSRLPPNVGGPNVSCRKLYAGVVRSMALYGAPIWAFFLTAENQALLRRPQRVMAVRMARAYRSVSHEAACVLAGTPPWDLDAAALADVYWRVTEARASGIQPPLEEEGETGTDDAVHDCGDAEDTALHTLAVCPAWAEQWAAPVAIVGSDLSLPAVVKAMLGGERPWVAAASFCEDVMAQKEAAERSREEDPASQPMCRKRVGRRRLAYDRRLPP